jgi:anti-sigma B factor antagonist
MAETLHVTLETAEAGSATAAVLRASGSIDGGAAETIEAVFAKALDGENAAIILDISAVRYIGSAGLRLMLQLNRRSEDRGVSFKVVGVRPSIKENTFDALGISRLVEMYGSTNDALAAMEDAGG